MLGGPLQSTAAISIATLHYPRASEKYPMYGDRGEK